MNPSLYDLLCHLQNFSCSLPQQEGEKLNTLKTDKCSKMEVVNTEVSRNFATDFSFSKI